MDGSWGLLRFRGRRCCADTGAAVDVVGPQVVLKWMLHQNIGVIPRSSSPDHVRENLNAFSCDLQEDDIARLDRGIDIFPEHDEL
jgi:diketogulonate reductase-like aldo/keto reductase